MDLNSLYQQLIIDHSKRPIGAGLREPYDVEVHHVNTSCGDEITLRVHLDGTTIDDISYDAQGCSISIAAASVMADTVTGVDVGQAISDYDEFKAIAADGKVVTDSDLEDLGDAAAFAGVAKFPARVKCALLGWAAMKDAVIQTGAVAEATSASAAH